MKKITKKMTDQKSVIIVRDEPVVCEETVIFPPAVTMETSSIAAASFFRDNVKVQAKLLSEKLQKLSEAKELCAEFDKFLQKEIEFSLSDAKQRLILDNNRDEIKASLYNLSQCSVDTKMELGVTAVMENIQNCLQLEKNIVLCRNQHNNQRGSDSTMLMFQQIKSVFPESNQHGFDYILVILIKQVGAAQKHYDEQLSTANLSAEVAKKEIRDSAEKYQREVEELELLIAAKKIKKAQCDDFHKEIEIKPL